MTWSEFQQRLMALTVRGGGPSKGSSGTLSVYFFEDGVYVELGTYDISYYPRHSSLGPYADEASALLAVKTFLDKAEKDVIDEEREQTDYVYGEDGNAD